MDERSLRARIEEGKLPVIRDGKVYRIAIVDLIAYTEERRVRVGA